MPASRSPADATSAPEGDAPWHGRPFSWEFTTPLFIGSALNPVNSSLIATALLPIARGLGVPVGQTAALVTALYLATAIAQPTAGKAAEVFGPRRVFLAGIVLVAVGGLVGGFAQDLSTLLVSRVLIGLGTSCAYPTAMLLIRRRARAAGLDKPPGGVLGGLQIAGITTASLGLPIGGLLVGAFGWRAVFFVNVPVALIALVATLAWVSPDGPFDRSQRPRAIASRLDLPGIGGFAAAMITLLLFLFGLPAAHWYVLGISVALWIALVAWELRARTPFLDVRLLAANLALTMTYLRFGLVLLCIYVVLYGITQWVESVRGVSETVAGLLLLPMTLISGVVVFPVSRRNLVRGAHRRRRVHVPARLRRRAAAQRLRLDRLGRRGHGRLRHRHGLRRRGKPDGPLLPGPRRAARHRLRAAADLRLRRVHRLLRHHRHRLPHSRHRQRRSPDRLDHDRRQRGPGPHLRHGPQPARAG